MVKVLVWGVALYASETWTLKSDDIKKPEALEMWIWRQIEKISQTEHSTNEQVLLMVGEQRSLKETIQERQRNWVGLILRGNSSLRIVLEGKIEGSRTRGKPRIKMLDHIVTQSHTKLSYSELKISAQD